MRTETSVLIARLEDSLVKKYGPRAKQEYEQDHRSFERLLLRSTGVNPETLRFYQAIFTRYTKNMYPGIIPHNLPDNVESYATERDAVVFGATTSQKNPLRPVENDVLIKDELLDDLAENGDLRGFLSALDGMLGEQLIKRDVWTGFHGVAQDEYFPKTNPEKANKGWIQLLREADSPKIISEIVTGSGVVTVGQRRKYPANVAAVVDKGSGLVGFPASAHGFPAGARFWVRASTNYNGPYLVHADTTDNEIVTQAAYVAETLTSSVYFEIIPDFNNLDHLVGETLSSGVIADSDQDQLAVIANPSLIGRQLDNWHAANDNPTEKAKAQFSLNTIGGLPRFSPSQCPHGKILLADPACPHMYYHTSIKRKQTYKEEKRGLMNYSSRMRTYRLEKPEAVVLYENIVMIQKFMD